MSGRTIRRDVDRLRELGYPVESLSGPGGGYRLRAGTAMPPLLLDDDEAIAIAVGLGTAARASVAGIEETAVRALVKLEQVLPAHLRRRVQALGMATVAPPVGGPTVDPQHLTVIAAACRDGECLRFAYRSRDAADTRRDVEPHSLVNLGRRWYLVAWDRGREDWRTFRVDRVKRPASTGVRFKQRALPAATRRPTSSGASRPCRTATRRGSRCTPRPPTIRSAGGRTVTPIDDHSCELPHRRRQPRLARDAGRDAPRRLRGPRAARAGRAPPVPRRPPVTGGDVKGIVPFTSAAARPLGRGKSRI